MGASTIPAAGGVAYSAADWTFIATAAPSGAANATFSSISGYKKLKLVAFVTPSVSSNIIVQFNSDTTSGNYHSTTYGASIFMTPTLVGATITNGIVCQPATFANGFFNLEINNANLTTVYKDAIGTSSASSAGGPTYGAEIRGVWKSTAAITSIVITPNGGGTITGNLYLMGQN